MVGAFRDLAHLCEFLRVDPRATVISRVHGHRQHDLQDDFEKSVSALSHLLLELHEVVGEDEVHDLLALVLGDQDPHGNSKLDWRGRDEGDPRQDPEALGYDHESDAITEKERGTTRDIIDEF